MNVESYLRGPLCNIQDDSFTIEALCYNSSVVGLTVNKLNLPEIFEQILNLGKPSNNNYVPAPLSRKDSEEEGYFTGVFLVNPSVHLGYAPARGLDTIIYLIKPKDENQSRYSIGYTKFPRVFGNSILNNVESLHYDQIEIRIPRLLINSDDYNSTLLYYIDNIGEINMNISDPQKTYLNNFKKRSNIEISGYTDNSVNLMSSCFFCNFPNQIDKDYSDKPFWWEGERVPAWVGPNNLNILVKESNGNYIRSYSNLINYYSVIYNLAKNPTIPANTETEENKFRIELPEFISKEYIIDQAGGLWICPQLVGKSEISFESEKYHPLFELKPGRGKTYPLPEIPESQPLLDISKGCLISEESVFKSILEAQHRVRDVVNTIIPLSLLLNDSGILWIRLKIGSWFIFDIPQFNSIIIQNRETAVIVPNDCRYYPINDKTLLVRSPEELILYNEPGEYCDEYTMNTVVTRFPHSKLLGRFTLGGAKIDEGDIFHSPLVRYRKNILPKGKIKIIGALNGVILYYQKTEDNNIYINYL